MMDEDKLTEAGGSFDLTSALKIVVGQQSCWREEESGEIFRHQMQTPLSMSLGVNAQRIINETAFGIGRVPTFQDLIFDLKPPLALLEKAKDFAKIADSGPVPSVPRPVALALYYAVLSVAITRHHTSISGLGDDELLNGFRWLCNQDWIDADIRSLGHQAIDALCNLRGSSFT
jgi:hypothetical protein